MMSEDDDFLPLSGLQHLLFCERQCALIHVEQLWDDNALTAQGGLLHERVDLPALEQRPGVRIERAVPLRSDRLRLIGKADVVEFHAVPGQPGRWQPFPVEYKRGRRRKWLHDEVQVCAQAMCLEEMVGVPVPGGALYYAASKRRLEVAMDDTLRAGTIAAALRYHELVARRETPPPRLMAKCRNCSLHEICLPELADFTPGLAARDLFRALGLGEKGKSVGC
jgi:CRISPR-associated exonuclease Cas4